jgi:Inner membrane protein YgaP-like, transmembrane domain
MKCNMGGLDRTLRAVAGVAILGAGAWLRSRWALVGLVPLLTAAIGWCPAYVPLGWSTKKG